ncbi:MAG: DUF2914 domain-containing protein [Deltaproteobacteria bacterium]|nr:DUF2914 domain-containing protein [Deltaproteobacteria bacterium]
MIRGSKPLLFSFIFIASLLIEVNANAQETAQIRLNSPSSESSVIIERSGKGGRLLKADVAFCREITEKNCVDAATSFSIDDARIFCHTVVHGAMTYLEIQHIWHHNGKFDQVVRLPVKSAQWRTWSMKNLFSGAEGSWKVEIYAGDLKIGEGEFSLTSQEPVVRENE